MDATYVGTLLARFTPELYRCTIAVHLVDYDEHQERRDFSVRQTSQK
jgi:hypothetical protein